MPRTRFEESTVETSEVQRNAEPFASPASFTLPPYLSVSPIVTPTTTFPESEQHIAVDPVQPSHLVIAVSDFADVHQGRNVTKFATSITNGATWLERYMETDVNGRIKTSDRLTWDANSDPVVAVHRSGNVYMSNLFLNGVADPNDQSNGIYVSVGTLTLVGDLLDGFTAATTYPVQVWTDPATQFFGDKEWIAVDNSGVHHPASTTDGNVYVTWTRFFNNDNAVRFSRSIDQGKTWSSPVRLNPDNQIGHLQGTQCDVGPDGTVYVLWEFTLFDNSRQVWFIRSLDGGLTWRAPHQISLNYNTIQFGSSYRTNSFAKMRVDQTTGVIHILWPSQPSFTLSGTINYSRSSNGGVSWTPRVRVNDVTGFSVFLPSIAVDDTGRLHASWYDTRNSGPAPGDPRFYDVYAAYSTTGGSTWSINKRVTPTSIDAGVGDRFLGDYNGIRAIGGFTHPIWTRGGFNDGVLQTTVLTIP